MFNENLLKNLKDSELFEQTHFLVKKERAIGVQILHRLKEIYRRRLYAVWGYSSLFTCLVEEFKYAEATASRLLNAMRIFSEVPELEEKIETGKLSVSTLAMVQSYCQAQKRENGLQIQIEEKKQILEAVVGCSKRQAEKVLISIHPEQPLPIHKEAQRVISPDLTEVTFYASNSLIEKLNRIHDLTAHAQGSMRPSYAELFDHMAELVLERIDPVRVEARIQKKAQHAKDSIKTAPIQAQAIDSRITSEPSLQLKAKMDTDLNENKLPLVKADEVKTKRTRYISAPLRRQVWTKCRSRCSYISPENGRRCSETRGLEIEHIRPFAQGGEHELANLELRCRCHNVLSAIQTFGSHMGRFISLRTP